jgi:hypothetical protein
MSSEAELLAVVFGQHFHSILILVISSSGFVLKDKVYNSNPQKEEENISREIGNIPEEQLQDLFRWCEECLRVQVQYF